MMKEFYKLYLFDKNVFVGEHGVQTSKTAFDVYISLAQLFDIKVTSGLEYLTPDMIELAERRLGRFVPEPFYKGFPESVKKLTPAEIVLDQVFHYFKTYGCGDFTHEEGECRSIFEENVERPLFKEKTDVKVFTAVDEKKAMEMIFKIASELAASSRPLSLEQYDLLKTVIDEESGSEAFIAGASKNTLIRLLIDTRDISRFTRYLSLSDVIKVVDELAYTKYGKKNVKKLNFKNQDRKFITGVLDYVFDHMRYSDHKRDIFVCFERKADWAGLLHHIHYKPNTSFAKTFVQTIRGNTNLSMYSVFESLMREGKPVIAAEYLKEEKGSGDLLRHLDYILSRCKNEEEIEEVLGNLDTHANGLILLQLYIKYRFPVTAGRRIFAWQKHEMMKRHVETDTEAKSRKSLLGGKTMKTAAKAIEKLLHKKYSMSILGKVYVDPEMKNIALPIAEGTSFGGYGALAKGSRIDIPKGKKVRAFTYWEKVNDIDLSAIALDEDFDQVGEYYWGNMHTFQTSRYITHSGDVTDGYSGGSEFMDIDLDAYEAANPNVRYLVFADQVYSRGSTFDTVVCRAGFMTRDISDSGEIFEPKTVKTSFTINCKSTTAYLFAIDLRRRQMVWLNTATDSIRNRVVTQENAATIKRWLMMADAMNVKTFFDICARELTDNPSEADVVVSDANNLKLKEGATQIRSCDMEAIMKYMNI